MTRATRILLAVVLILLGACKHQRVEHLTPPTPQTTPRTSPPLARRPTPKPVLHTESPRRPRSDPVEPARPRSSLQALVFSTWPGDDSWASRIVSCESQWNQREISSTNDWGLFQLHEESDHVALAASLGYSWSQMLEPVPNTRVAWLIYRSEGPGAWVCNG